MDKYLECSSKKYTAKQLDPLKMNQIVALLELILCII